MKSKAIRFVFLLTTVGLSAAFGAEFGGTYIPISPHQEIYYAKLPSPFNETSITVSKSESGQLTAIDVVWDKHDAHLDLSGEDYSDLDEIQISHHYSGTQELPQFNFTFPYGLPERIVADSVTTYEKNALVFTVGSDGSISHEILDMIGLAKEANDHNGQR